MLGRPAMPAPIDRRPGRGADRRSRPRPSSSARGSHAGPSVLLVDIGNTRIKWTLWRAGRLSRPRAEVYTGWSSDDFARHLFLRRGAARPRVPARVIVASVADERVLRRLAAGARKASRAGGARAAALEVIQTSRRAAGVVTRYEEPWRLGVDRFLGVIAAHHLAGSRPACVISAGTAVTLDLVDGQGVHRGGVILPGPRLMIESLLQRTAGIARRTRGLSRARLSSASRLVSRGGARAGRRSMRFLARDTAAAIEQGASNAIAGAVERAIAACRRQLSEAAPLVILTGGEATELRRALRLPCLEVPDLVLRGIALHGGLALR